MGIDATLLASGSSLSSRSFWSVEGSPWLVSSLFLSDRMFVEPIPFSHYPLCIPKTSGISDRRGFTGKPTFETYRD